MSGELATDAMQEHERTVPMGMVNASTISAYAQPSQANIVKEYAIHRCELHDGGHNADELTSRIQALLDAQQGIDRGRDRRPFPPEGAKTPLLGSPVAADQIRRDAV